MICYLRILVLTLFWSTPSCSSFGPHRRLVTKVFMSPRVLSVHASSSLPLWRIKLNKSPGIKIGKMEWSYITLAE